MYDRVKAWVFERGGRLMYLGGNGLNCEVEFLDDATIVCRNGDAREVTRRGLESRFHLSGESEANLLGVVYDERGIMTAAPYRVVDAGHWAFEGPGVGEGDVFGRESLHMRCQGGASGHETDKISPSSPANVRRLAKGMNPGDGGADMAYFETAERRRRLLGRLDHLAQLDPRRRRRLRDHRQRAQAVRAGPCPHRRVVTPRGADMPDDERSVSRPTGTDLRPLRRARRPSRARPSAPT